MQEIHHLERYVLEIQDFLTGEQCLDLVSEFEAKGFEQALVNTQSGAELRPEIRNNDRLIEDNQELADKLWARLQPYTISPFKNRVAIGLNERLRVYRYGAEQKFDWHQDGFFERENGEISQYTFMIYLNDDCVGGGTSFCDVYSGSSFPDFTISPKTGSALLFYHPIMHRGDEVISGKKYVLRSDVMYGPSDFA